MLAGWLADSQRYFHENTWNHERNVRFCTKNYVFIWTVCNTSSTCQTKLMLYRLKDRKIERIICQTVYLDWIVYPYSIYSSDGLLHESWCISFLRTIYPVVKLKLMFNTIKFVWFCGNFQDYQQNADFHFWLHRARCVVWSIKRTKCWTKYSFISINCFSFIKLL